MALVPGVRLGHYEILAPLGAGGMGEVYGARDTTLGRDVALKVLPPEYARDPDRLARLEREAKLLASLSHPGLATLYGLEEIDGQRVLIMERVEGEDLAQRLRRGAMPVGETLEVARQVAEALEAAHDRGIVHRDLKPANVMLTPEGRARVVDFGLAKAWAGDTEASASDLSRSPTLANSGTLAGVILGTAAYMSPEQASGPPRGPPDRRLGFRALVSLREMLTGRPVFSGETASEVLAAVLKDEPDWSRLPSDLPPGIGRLLKRCLQKKPRERTHDMGDVRLEIEEALAGGGGAADAPALARGRGRGEGGELEPRGVILFAADAGVGLSRVSDQGGEPRPVTRLDPGRGENSHRPDDLSPDGRWLLFETWMETGDQGDLWLLPLEGPREPRPWLKTSSVESSAAFSPDGRYVAYSSDQSGRDEVYVMPFLDRGRRWQISAEGGMAPDWQRDGKRLHYRSPGGTVHAVEVDTRGEEIRIDSTRSLFRAARDSVYVQLSAVTPDARRILALEPVPEAPAPEVVNVLVNWPAHRVGATGRDR